MKKCPYCAEQIQDEAIVCRFCDKVLDQKQFDDVSALFQKNQYESGGEAPLVQERLKSFAGEKTGVALPASTYGQKKLCTYCEKELTSTSTSASHIHINVCPACQAEDDRIRQEATEMMKGFNGDTLHIIYLTEQSHSLYRWWLEFLGRAVNLTADGEADVDTIFHEFKELSYKPDVYPFHKNVEWRKYFDYMVFSTSRLPLWQKRTIRNKLQRCGVDPNTFWLDLSV